MEMMSTFLRTPLPFAVGRAEGFASASGSYPSLMCTTRPICHGSLRQNRRKVRLVGDAG
jgi:hypothetical protein